MPERYQNRSSLNAYARLPVPGHTNGDIKPCQKWWVCICMRQMLVPFCPSGPGKNLSAFEHVWHHRTCEIPSSDQTDIVHLRQAERLELHTAWMTTDMLLAYCYDTRSDCLLQGIECGNKSISILQLFACTPIQRSRSTSHLMLIRNVSYPQIHIGAAISINGCLHINQTRRSAQA